MVTELRICPTCETPYDRVPGWRHSRCPQCIGSMGGAHVREYGRSREAPEPQPAPQADPEVDVLAVLADTMNRLDQAARGRALTWLLARYGDAL